MSDSSPNELKTPESSPFMLKSDAAFGSRVGDVFGNLGHIEARHTAYQKARSRSVNGKTNEYSNIPYILAYKSTWQISRGQFLTL